MSDDFEDFFSGAFDKPRAKPEAFTRSKMDPPRKRRPRTDPTQPAAAPKKARREEKPREPPPREPITLRQVDKRDMLKAVQDFFEGCADTTGTIYIGIDPGSEGAIGLLHPSDHRQTTVVDMPMVEITLTKKTKSKKNFRKRNRLDVAALWSYFQIVKEWRHRVVVVLETQQPRATDNGITGYAVGFNHGTWPLFLHSHEIQLVEADPLTWKRAMNLLRKDKECSRLMAQKLWPLAPLVRVGDHNRAEALLLAEYQRRLDRGGKL